MTNEGWRVTVGVTEQGAEHLSELMETGWFDSETAVYLLAISTALAQLPAATPVSLVGTTTKFNVGTLDREGKLRNLIRLLGPSDYKDPYEYAERLADSGLEYLRTKVVDEGLTLSEVLTPQSP